jgi:4-hydroxy-tetrahydrodipicolinate synthase
MGRGIPWEGAYPAIVTPFNEDGSIDDRGFATIVERFMGWGVHGLVIAGHNGEGWALQHGERAHLTRIARRVIGDRVPIVVGIDAITSAEVVKETREVLAAGADGIMVEPPFLITTATKDETVQRFSEVLEGCGCPVILYNNPRRLQINISLDIYAALTKHKHLVGIKEAYRDLAHLVMLIKQTGNDATVFVGPAPFILPGVLMGARGFISSGPLELMGAEGVELYNACLKRDLDRATALAYRATAMYPMLFGIGTWPASLKAAMNMLGLPAGVPRRPVLPLDRTATAQLRSNLEKIGVLGAPAAAR